MYGAQNEAVKPVPTVSLSDPTSPVQSVHGGVDAVALLPEGLPGGREPGSGNGEVGDEPQPQLVRDRLEGQTGRR